MRRSTACSLVVAAVALFGYAAPAAAADEGGPDRPDSTRFETCRLEGLIRAAQCGTVSVDEDRARRGGRRLSIHIAVVPATRRAQPDPIVVLMGGPGEDAIGAASLYAAQFASLLDDRDLVLIDQRGTGHSHPLACSLYSAAGPVSALRDMFPEIRVRACAERLKAQADLRRYLYADFAEDIEDIRKALGYGAVNLFAGSYGTRAAQVCKRAYPKSVRTAYLGSVIPIDLSIPLTFAKTADAVLDCTLDACAADRDCRTAFPQLRGDLARMLADLDADKAVVRPSGGSGPVALGRGRVVEWLRSRMYRPAGAAEVPYVIHRAAGGDWQPIADGIIASARGLDDALSLGLFFSITCSEDLAEASPAEIQRATEGTRLGDYRARQQWNACQRWPKAALPDGYRRPLRSSIPTLFVSGDIDAAAPLEFTQHVARGFSDKAELVDYGHGHTQWSDCAAKAFALLVRTGSTAAIRPLSCDRLPRPPFKTS